MAEVIATVCAALLLATTCVLSFVDFVALVRLALKSSNSSDWVGLAICAGAVLPAAACLLQAAMLSKLFRNLRDRGLRWLDEEEQPDIASRECAEVAGEHQRATIHNIRIALDELQASEDSVDFGMVVHALFACSGRLRDRERTALHGIATYLCGLLRTPAETVLDRLLNDGHSPEWLVEELLNH